MANRGQNRQAAREKKIANRPKTRVCLGPDELKLKLYETEREKKIVAKVVHELNIVTLMVARDKLKFGKKRLMRLYNFLLEMWDAVETGHVSAADMERTLIEEVGIEIFQVKL